MRVRIPICILITAFVAMSCDQAPPTGMSDDVVVEAPATFASVHLKGGKNAEPSFVDNVLTLYAEGELSGLGNGDIRVLLDATANVTATCTNQGGNQAPGQNPAPVSISGANVIPEEDFEKNGNVFFWVETDEPETPIPGAPDCPNPNWSEDITDLSFTSALIRIEQPAYSENIVFSVFCTIDPPSSDGAIKAKDVTCS